jgi:chromosome condensin MukBEF MukE localization factor|tara:strand:+ start:810 stop:1037 length:228 start_codon:yes stop_codon:yes gene_type:complete
MRKLVVLFSSIVFCFAAFAHEADPVLNDDPTEAQMQLVRDGAMAFCESVDDENERQVCVMDYYAQHNLEEEPSCD